MLQTGENKEKRGRPVAGIEPAVTPLPVYGTLWATLPERIRRAPTVPDWFPGTVKPILIHCKPMKGRNWDESGVIVLTECVPLNIQQPFIVLDHRIFIFQCHTYSTSLQSLG